MKNKCVIITRNPSFFSKIGNYNYCDLEELKSLPDKIAFDFETTSLSPRDGDVFCCQIGTREKNYLIDFQTIGKDRYTFKDVIPYLKDKILVGHNIGFDTAFMYKYEFYPENVRDTMLSSQCLYNGVKRIFFSKHLDKQHFFTHSFGDVMELELDAKYDKSEQSNISKTQLSTAKAINYSLNDVDRLLELEEFLYNKHLQQKSEKNYLFQCKFLLAQAYIEHCGLPVSYKLWENKCKQDIINQFKAGDEVKDYIYKNLPKFRNTQLDLFGLSDKIVININSSQQMIAVFKELGINTWDEKEEKDSIAENQISKSDHEFIKIWLNYQEHNHRVTTFGNNILNQIKDNRLFSRFRTLAESGRMISRAKEINFLNFPSDKATRECFECEPGWKIVGCDYDSQESRILAYESQDLNSKLNVLQNRDAHSLLAREAFPYLKGKTDKEIKKDFNKERQIGKVINFSASFGATGYTIATNLNLPLTEGERLYKVYKDLYADVFTWGEKIFQQSIKVGYIESCYGFRKYLPDFKVFTELNEHIKSIDWDKYKPGKEEYKLYKIAKEKNQSYYVINKDCFDYYRSEVMNVSKFFRLKANYFNLSLNHPIQSKASFQSKLAAIKLFKIIKDNGHINQVKISNLIYDEINLEVKEELAHQYQIILQNCMMDAGNFFINNDKEIKITAEAHIGSSWYSVK